MAELTKDAKKQVRAAIHKDDAVEVLRLLREHKTSIDPVVDGDGNSVLTYAAWYGSTAVMAMQLGRGANAHHKDWWDRTALHWGSLKGHVPVVRLMLAAGADPHSKDSAGNTALYLAKLYKHQEVVDLLVRARPVPVGKGGRFCLSEL